MGNAAVTSGINPLNIKQCNIGWIQTYLYTINEFYSSLNSYNHIWLRWYIKNDDSLKKWQWVLLCERQQGTATVSETESCNFIRLPQGWTREIKIYHYCQIGKSGYLTSRIENMKWYSTSNLLIMIFICCSKLEIRALSFCYVLPPESTKVKDNAIIVYMPYCAITGVVPTRC